MSLLSSTSLSTLMSAMATLIEKLEKIGAVVADAFTALASAFDVFSDIITLVSQGIAWVETVYDESDAETKVGKVMDVVQQTVAALPEVAWDTVSTLLQSFIEKIYAAYETIYDGVVSLVTDDEEEETTTE